MTFGFWKQAFSVGTSTGATQTGGRGIMSKKRLARLTKEERGDLRAPVKKGKALTYKIKHANILLTTDAERFTARWPLGNATATGGNAESMGTSRPTTPASN